MSNQKGRYKFVHGPDLGDIVFSLAVIRHLGGGVLYLHAPRDNHMAKYWGALTFIRDQPYIDEVIVIRSRKILEHNVLNFDGFLKGNIRRSHLLDLHFEAMGMKAPPVIEPWLTVRKTDHYYPVVLYATGRYPGPAEYSFLDIVPKDQLFCIGYEGEAEKIVKETGATWIETKEFHELAAVVGSCGVLIGNQSSPLAVAHGLGKNRFYERSEMFDNCFTGLPEEKVITTDRQTNIRILKDFGVLR